MRTNVEIDDQLMATALKLTKIKTKKAVIEKALELLIRLENQSHLALFKGKIEVDDKAFE